jgi:3-hydroxyisobutyrate dehydrogenase-like beta-hydroxyacid dehydrogenase
MAGEPVGFIGLGNMGGQLCANLVAFGHRVVCHDACGPERAPEGASHLDSVAEVAEQADVIVLSLPDGSASTAVASEILAAKGRRCTHVIDTSTIGPQAAIAIGEQLGDQGVAYLDAPVSGGPAGARARTLAVMYGGSDEACAHVTGVLSGLSDKLHRVGDRPGPAQALKLANNFLSATALAATSEAVSFGVAAGLDMATMLEVLNGASGKNTATEDKFPNHVLTGRYASGFSNSLMAKDLQLYLRSVEASGGPTAIGSITASVWERFAEAEPGVDFTRIFPYTEGA